MHYRPSFLLCFWHNRKLQKYYERVKEEQFSHRVMLGEQGEIAIPTVEFNLIFQLTHIYAHLMNEGIGLRQLLDYYYVLCDFYKVYQKSSKITPTLSPSGEREETALLGARNRYALRMADHQRSRQIVRDGTALLILACGLLMDLLMGLLIGLGLLACGLLMGLLLYKYW